MEPANGGAKRHSSGEVRWQVRPRHKKIGLSCSAVLSRRHLLSPTPQLSCSSLRLHKVSSSRICLVFSSLTSRYCPKTASSEFAPSGHCTQRWSQRRRKVSGVDKTSSRGVTNTYTDQHIQLHVHGVDTPNRISTLFGSSRGFRSFFDSNSREDCQLLFR